MPGTAHRNGDFYRLLMRRICPSELMAGECNYRDRVPKSGVAWILEHASCSATWRT